MHIQQDIQVEAQQQLSDLQDKLKNAHERKDLEMQAQFSAQLKAARNSASPNVASDGTQVPFIGHAAPQRSIGRESSPPQSSGFSSVDGVSASLSGNEVKLSQTHGKFTSGFYITIFAPFYQSFYCQCM